MKFIAVLTMLGLCGGMIAAVVRMLYKAFALGKMAYDKLGDIEAQLKLINLELSLKYDALTQRVNALEALVKLQAKD